MSTKRYKLPIEFNADAPREQARDVLWPFKDQLGRWFGEAEAVVIDAMAQHALASEAAAYERCIQLVIPYAHSASNYHISELIAKIRALASPSGQPAPSDERPFTPLEELCNCDDEHCMKDHREPTDEEINKRDALTDEQRELCNALGPDIDQAIERDNADALAILTNIGRPKPRPKEGDLLRVVNMKCDGTVECVIECSLAQGGDALAALKAEVRREYFEAGVMSRKDWWEALVATYFGIFKVQPPESMKACEMSHTIVDRLSDMERALESLLGITKDCAIYEAACGRCQAVANARAILAAPPSRDAGGLKK